MRTVRLLTVEKGVVSRGCVGGCVQVGAHIPRPRGTPCNQRQTPPPVDRQTPVKTLPCPKPRVQAVKMCSLQTASVKSELFEHWCQSEVFFSEKILCSL